MRVNEWIIIKCLQQCQSKTQMAENAQPIFAAGCSGGHSSPLAC